MPPDEFAPAFRINPRYMDCALALDLSHDLGHRVSRRDCYYHVHTVEHQTPHFNPALGL